MVITDTILIAVLALDYSVIVTIAIAIEVNTACAACWSRVVSLEGIGWQRRLVNPVQAMLKLNSACHSDTTGECQYVLHHYNCFNPITNFCR